MSFPITIEMPKVQNEPKDEVITPFHKNLYHKLEDGKDTRISLEGNGTSYTIYLMTGVSFNESFSRVAIRTYHSNLKDALKMSNNYLVSRGFINPISIEKTIEESIPGFQKPSYFTRENTQPGFPFN